MGKRSRNAADGSEGAASHERHEESVPVAPVAQASLGELPAAAMAEAVLRFESAGTGGPAVSAPQLLDDLHVLGTAAVEILPDGTLRRVNWHTEALDLGDAGGEADNAVDPDESDDDLFDAGPLPAEDWAAEMAAYAAVRIVREVAVRHDDGEGPLIIMPLLEQARLAAYAGIKNADGERLWRHAHPEAGGAGTDPWAALPAGDRRAWSVYAATAGAVWRALMAAEADAVAAATPAAATGTAPAPDDRVFGRTHGIGDRADLRERA